MFPFLRGPQRLGQDQDNMAQNELGRPRAADGTYGARLIAYRDQILAHQVANNAPRVRPNWARAQRADPEPPPRQNAIERAPADNQLVMGGMAAAGGNLHRSILRNLDIPPFGQLVMNGHGLDIIGYCVGTEIVSLRVDGSAMRRQQVILEMLAPWVPGDMVLNNQEAQAELNRLVFQRMGHLRDHRWFADGVDALHREFPPPAPPQGQGAGQAAGQQAGAGAPAAPRVAHISHIWDPVGRQWLAGTTLAQILELFTAIIENLDDQQRVRLLYPALLLIVSFSVRGQISQAKLSRIINDLQPIMPNIAGLLNQADIAATWRNFGQYVNDGNIADVFRRWINYIPQGAIRLRVIMAQAAGSGITQLDVIARAYLEHPDFPWAIIANRFYHEEWEHAMEAIRLVGNNPYYGFRHDLQAVRSTRYRRLAWMCGQLLIRAGDRALENYRGFQEDRVNSSVIRDLIDAYLRGAQGIDLDREIDEEEFWFVHINDQALREYAGGLDMRANMAGHQGPGQPPAPQGGGQGGPAGGAGAGAAQGGAQPGGPAQAQQPAQAQGNVAGAGLP